MHRLLVWLRIAEKTVAVLGSVSVGLAVETASIAIAVDEASLTFAHGEGEVADEIDLFTGVADRVGVHLDRVKLVLAHDRLANVYSVHVAPVADISESKVQIVALEADPVADSLHFRLFRCRIVLGLLKLLLLLRL